MSDTRDPLPSTVDLLDDGRPWACSFDALLCEHASPGGVAIAFKVLERGLPLLAGGGLCERRAVAVRTAFAGPGARDAFEHALGAVTDGRYHVDASLARPGLGLARERFVFCLSRGERAAALLLREGYVDDEFVLLARRDPRTDDEEQRLTRLKRRLADRVMGSAADAVLDVADPA